MTIDDIHKMRRYGDLVEVGQILGIGRMNAYNALMRPTSKNHSEVLRIITALIKSREDFKEQISA